MHLRILLIAILAWNGFAACGRGAPEAAPPQHRVEEPTDTVAEPPHAVNPTTALIGSWELRSDPPQRMPGIRLTVTVDSVFGKQYFGRLTNYFSGNVGGDPREYENIIDSIRAGGAVTFVMPTVDRDMLGIEMHGTLTTDTIHLDRFVLGPDTLSSGARRWLLLKEY